MIQAFDSLYKVRSTYKAINGWRAAEEGNCLKSLLCWVVAEGGKAKGRRRGGGAISLPAIGELVQ